jgi:hypothetical protein
MILLEFYEKQPSGYYDGQDDQSKPTLAKFRKSKLTLRQLNKLRRMNDVRRFEYKTKLDRIRKQYAVAAEPGI